MAKKVMVPLLKLKLAILWLRDVCLVFPLPDGVVISLRPNGFPCKAAVRPVGRHSWPLAQIKGCLGEREGAEGGRAHRADPLHRGERSGAGWDSPGASGFLLLKTPCRMRPVHQGWR